MRLTLSEIRQRAIAFGHDWKDETSERSEAQTFWNEFFNVFGINRRSVASFERTVRNVTGAYDRIDVIWNGRLIGEHKSRGQDLSKAASQAFDYIQSLTRAHSDAEIPRFIIVSDFATIVLHDLEATNPRISWGYAAAILRTPHRSRLADLDPHVILTTNGDLPGRDQAAHRPFRSAIGSDPLCRLQRNAAPNRDLIIECGPSSLAYSWELTMKKPTKLDALIDRYYARLDEFKQQFALHEGAVSEAFQTLLADAGRPHHWTLIPQLTEKRDGKAIRPDGTFKDIFSQVRGHWET